jgi:hypothetical protein
MVSIEYIYIPLFCGSLYLLFVIFYYHDFIAFPVQNYILNNEYSYVPLRLLLFHYGILSILAISIHGEVTLICSSFS